MPRSFLLMVLLVTMYSIVIDAEYTNRTGKDLSDTVGFMTLMPSALLAWIIVSIMDKLNIIVPKVSEIHYGKMAVSALLIMSSVLAVLFISIVSIDLLV